MGLLGKLLCKLGRHDLLKNAEGRATEDGGEMKEYASCRRCPFNGPVKVTKYPRIFDEAMYRPGRLGPTIPMSEADARLIAEFLEGSSPLRPEPIEADEDYKSS